MVGFFATIVIAVPRLVKSWPQEREGDALELQGAVWAVLAATLFGILWPIVLPFTLAGMVVQRMANRKGWLR